MHPMLRVLVLGMCLSLLAGCGVTKPSRFYLLTPTTETGATTTRLEVAIGVGPVALPEYLDRSEIARRAGDNQIKYAGTHRWAEPLKVSFSRVLSENLATMIPTEQVVIFPWARAIPIDYQVTVVVTGYEADESGYIRLATNWQIIRTDDTTVIARRMTSYRETAASTDYADLVTAQSRALASLSWDIVKAIRAEISKAGP